MGSRQEYQQKLRALPASEWTAFLDANSGLPGPRGNLELIQASADEGTAAWFEELATSADEFRAATGAVGLGRLLADAPDERVMACLHELSADRRWRVREGVAMALQRLGDADPARLWPLARAWAIDPDPLVQRAAVAGVCEPRLLCPAAAAAVALEICAKVTGDVGCQAAGAAPIRRRPFPAPGAGLLLERRNCGRSGSRRSTIPGVGRRSRPGCDVDRSGERQEGQARSSTERGRTRMRPAPAA